MWPIISQNLVDATAVSHGAAEVTHPCGDADASKVSDS
jgi:hypothetical protein